MKAIEANEIEPKKKNFMKSFLTILNQKARKRAMSEFKKLTIEFVIIALVCAIVLAVTASRVI